MKSKEIKKRSKAKVIIPIVLLLIIVLGIGGYFVYNNFFAKKDVKEDKVVVEKFKEVENTNKLYQDSNVLSDDNNNYLVVKKDNSWYEADHNVSSDDIGFQTLGAYKDKLYYADKNGLKYVDLNDSSLTPVKFAMKSDVNYDNFSYYYFENNKLYIEVEGDPSANTAVGQKKHYAILIYDLTSNYSEKRGDILTVVEEEYPVDFYVVSGKIYYLEGSTDEYKVRAYDPKEDKTSTIAEKICYLDVYKDHLLINRMDPNSEQEKCNDYYFLNVNNKKEIYIGNVEKALVLGNILYSEKEGSIYKYSEKSGKLELVSKGYMNPVGDYLYYITNNKIYKYVDGKSTTLHVGDDNYKIRGFSVYNDTGKDIIIVYTRAETYAVVDGVKKSAQEVEKTLFMYNVNMKNGTKKVFGDESSDTEQEDKNTLSLDEDGTTEE